MTETTFELLKAIIPSVITASVAIIALVTSAYSSKKATQISYSNNIDNMRFTQKEKLSDQINEKTSLLLTITDPNYLNTIINKITPKEITDSEFTEIQTKLLSVPDNIQTLSTNIKLLSYSIREPQTQEIIFKIFNEMDYLHKQVEDMIMKLIKIYCALTPNGNIENITVMAEKYKLETSFSKTYPKYYEDFSVDMVLLVETLKKNSIPQNKI